MGVAPFDMNTRRSAATAAGLAAAGVLGSTRPAQAATRCLECVGDGTTQCGSCKGSGQFKMFGDRGFGEGMSYQYAECPDCYGAGVKVCGKCLGTGLPQKKMIGILRNPEYKQFILRIKQGRVDVENIKEIQAEIQIMMATEEKNKALKMAEAAVEASKAKAEQANSPFGLPNFF